MLCSNSGTIDTSMVSRYGLGYGGIVHVFSVCGIVHVVCSLCYHLAVMGLKDEHTYGKADPNASVFKSHGAS